MKKNYLSTIHNLFLRIIFQPNYVRLRILITRHFDQYIDLSYP